MKTAIVKMINESNYIIGIINDANRMHFANSNKPAIWCTIKENRSLYITK